MENTVKGRIKKLDGFVFGRLTVTGFSHMDVVAYWDCKCKCGKSVTANGSRLRQGRVRSCGCLAKETASKLMTTHGLSRSPIYESYRSMIKRCTIPSDKEYHNYGGRGITVCDRWLESFEAFASDMGERPKGKTLDRRDSSGNYSPDNCRWSTHKVQANNKRNNVYLEIDGERKTIREWSDISGVAYQTIQRRAKNYGWSHRDAVFTPSKRVKNNK